MKYLCCVLVVTCLLGPGLCQVSNFVYNGDPKIASRTEFVADCVDSDGNIRTHLDEWPTLAGGCDVNHCYNKGENLKFKVSYRCPVMVKQNVDPTNCIEVSNTAAAFPGCCSRLECSEGSIPVVSTPSCYDRSPAWACQIWKTHTGCVTNTDIKLQTQFNITVDYCRLTCGLAMRLVLFGRCIHQLTVIFNMMYC